MCVLAILLFLFTRPASRVSLKHTQRHHGETSKGKAYIFFSAGVFVLVLTPLIRINARGLPAEVDAFKKMMKRNDEI